MKKKNILPLLIIPFFLLTSCEEQDKITLIFGDVSAETTTLITHSQLTSLVLDDETFIVVTTPLSNCACWSTFKNQVLNQYIAENHVLVYEINYEDFYAGETNLDTFGRRNSSSIMVAHYAAIVPMLINIYRNMLSIIKRWIKFIILTVN